MDNGNDLKFQVFSLLRRGRYKAIPGKLLAERCGLKDDRRIRDAICLLIQDGIPIVSSTVWPRGFYIAETKEEIKEYAKTMRSRLVEIAIHRRNLLRTAENILTPEQLKMKL
jgi:pyruvate-formate lyase-activating enzyme